MLRTQEFLEQAYILKRWHKGYNYVRPHSVLNYRVPCPEAIIPLILVVLLMGAG